MSVLAYCGLRVSELVALTVRSIDTNIDLPMLQLRGTKGGKLRAVPLPADTATAINTYLADRAILAGSSPALALDQRGLLFIRTDGGPLSQPLIDKLLRRLCTTASVEMPEGAMAHGLRHFYGSQLAIRGVPLAVIQQLLGHNSPSTTSIYTRTHSDDLSQALSEAGML